MLTRFAAKRTRPAKRPAGFVLAASPMTLDIFFERYLLTLHAIVVAIGLIVYVAAARALPQRRDPSAAIAWVVALALLPYVALPLYLMFGSRKLRMRDAPPLALPPVAARRRRRRGGLALGAPPRPLDGPGAGRRLPKRCASTPTAPRRAPRVLELIAGATRDDRRLHLHPRHATASATRSRGAAQPGRARRQVRLLIDGIGAWLGGRLDMKALQPLRRRRS